MDSITLLRGVLAGSDEKKIGMVSFKLVIGVLFGLLVAGIVSLGILSYQKNQASNESSYWVRRSHQVMDKIERVSALYKDIQLESNAFFISGDSSIISPYTDAKKMISEELKNARILTKDNPDQQERLDALESILKDLITFSDSVLLIPRQGYSEKSLLSRVRSNRAFRANIRKIVDDLRDEEKRLLGIREEAQEDSIASFHRTCLLMLMAISMLLATTFLAIRYTLNRRVRAEVQLTKANELFSKLFHESPIGMVISQLEDDVITDCNEAYSELVNYPREEIVGKTAMSLKLLSNVNEWNEIVQAALEHGIVRDIEVALQPKGNEPLWVSISTQVIQIQNKRCLLSAVLDMSVHKRAEDDIKKALAAEVELNKMKSNFVALASHEFRTPLTAILSSTFLLEKYSSGDDQKKAAKHIARIKSSVNNLTSILDEFLSLTKIEEGKIESKLDRLNLKEHLDRVCLSLRSSAKPGQNIIYSHSGDLHVYTDPVLVRNIVNNLVSNAIKYSDDSSNIYVSSTANSRIHIAVRDSGIGIPKEDQKYLFNRFYRASNAGTVQGTGLGLHITKHYVDMLNGSIHVNSEVGKGTEFEVIFESPAVGQG
jgi:PAS domain S-box-containing protein